MKREAEIFKYAKPFMGSRENNGFSYAKNNAEFYKGKEAKQVLIGKLIKGYVEEDFLR